jgi:MYXO-CTERM domain-containing protein
MFGYDQQPGGPCSGDSGGPSYILRDGVEYVAGVTSYGDQECAQYGASTTADRFAGWIDAFIAPEICGNGIDDDGDGRIDCADRECGGDTTCPDTCETAEAVHCQDVIHSTTDGGSWAFSQYSCLRDGVENGPEVAFRVDAPAGTRITADLTPGPGGDLDFFLLPATGSSCDPQACLDGSFDYNTSEQIVFVVPAGGVYLVVETWDKPTSFDLRIMCGVPEVCTNGVDDDYDGRADCVDPDCSEDPACLPAVEDCTNGIDDDEDGAADCDDEDCAAEPACQIPDEDCSNGLDDDQDGDADCDDADCAEFPACLPPPPENCNNGLDDDQDGALDCDDSDCTDEAICQAYSGGGGGGCAATSAAGPGNLAFLLLGLLLSLRFRRK